jgi:hypothetical protein
LNRVLRLNRDLVILDDNLFQYAQYRALLILKRLDTYSRRLNLLKTVWPLLQSLRTKVYVGQSQDQRWQDCRSIQCLTTL